MAAAHWFDRKRFLLEADRVLRPGGCLALLSYTMDFELEYGGVSNTALNHICEEYYTALRPFRNPHIGTSSMKIYSDLNECVRVKRIMPLSGYIALVETFSTYQTLLQKNPAEAERLSNDTRTKTKLHPQDGGCHPACWNSPAQLEMALTTGPLTDTSTVHRNMAVRVFEGKAHAAAYLQYRITPDELISRIMSYMEKKTPNQFNLAVDVGCGSGQGTILLAPYFTKVVGTDVSPAQLQMALTNGCPPNVSY
ncbi:hypothetical protein FQN60_006838, partial [Etheostoma spectabile]